MAPTLLACCRVERNHGADRVRDWSCPNENHTIRNCRRRQDVLSRLYSPKFANLSLRSRSRHLAGTCRIAAVRRYIELFDLLRGADGYGLFLRRRRACGFKTRFRCIEWGRESDATEYACRNP